MKVIVVNYANDKYKAVQELNTKTAYKNGADLVFSYGPSDIDSTFLEKNQKILSEERGNGLWLWKPYLIKKTLAKLNDGDILFYCDSGAFFTGNIKKLIKLLDNFEIASFDIPLIEEQFTKKMTFEKMDCNENKYKQSNQIIGTYFIMKKTKFVETFVDEWLKLCCDYDLISPSKNQDESEKFISHREDQSIFSLLCKKYDIRPYNDISQRYYFPKTYKFDKRFIYKIPKHTTIKLPVIIYLHKQSNLTLFKFLKQLIKLFFSIFRF